MTDYTSPEYWANRIWKSSYTIFCRKETRKIRSYAIIGDYIVTSVVNMEELEFWRKVYNLIEKK